MSAAALPPDPSAVSVTADVRVMRWAASPATDLAWVNWGDQYVLYHRPSGKTHFVNEATWLLLERVLSQARDASTTTDELARLQGLTADDALRSYVPKLLMRLEEIGLVVRA